MSPPPNVFNASANTTADEETRMRQALGLRDDSRGEVAHQRHDQHRRGRHFVRDGEVPVVVLNNSRDHSGDPATSRIEAAEAARRAEQAARERADRALHDAMETIQHLRTQLAHAELSHGEALAAERGRTAQAEAALRDAVTMRDVLEARVAELMAQRRVVAEPRDSAEGEQPKPAPSRRAPRIVKAVAVKAVAVKASAAREPQPVKWWLPSAKSKSR